MRLAPRRWFVLTGNRLLVAALLVAAFGLAVLTLMATGVVDVRNTTRMLYLFQVLVGGNVTLVTIVLSINQLVLSREFKTPGELHDQIQNVISYRDSVEETTDSTTVPVTPSDFLFTLLDGIEDTARQLRENVKSQKDGQIVDEVNSLCSEFTADVDRIENSSAHTESRIFNALVASFETDYSHQLNEVHRIQTVYGNEFSPAVREEFDKLKRSIQQVDIARQYFKSIYMQSELARLSRVLLYVGVPAAASALLMLFVYVGSAETPVVTDYLELLIPAVMILGFSPLAVLSVYVLRIAVVAQRTVAITPFVTPDQSLETPDEESEGSER